jgi:ATP-dependent Lhr-like helicase
MNNPPKIKIEVLRAFFGNFRDLNSIQKESIPILNEGKNIIISAGTGSGKTEAVLAPIVSRYLDYALLNDSITWLYVTPTKALANDILRRIEPIFNILHLNIGIRHGDRDDTTKVKIPHFLITTPESLDVLLTRGNNSLNNVRAIILDEVHILYNTQRGLQASLIISRLKSQILKNPVQIACLSATIASCEDIGTFLFGTSESFYHIKKSSERTIDALIKFVDYEVDLPILVKKILKFGNEKLLFFANSRKQCDYIGSILSSIEDLRAYTFIHYSSLSAQLREETEKKFNEAQTAICVATSTLELGIDIGDVDAVVLCDPPSSVSSFLQRIGRGSRRISKTNAICLVSAEDNMKIFDLLYFYAIIDLARGGRIEKIKPMKLYGSFAQQVMIKIAANKGAYTKIETFVDIAKVQNHLTKEVINDILVSLSEEGFIKPHGFKYRYGADEKLYFLLDRRLIYGNIPISSQEIAIMHKRKEIGHISVSNLLKIFKGTIIRFAGKCWKIIKIDEKEIQVLPHEFIQNAFQIKYSSKGKFHSDILILNRLHDYLNGESINLSCFGKIGRQLISEVLRQSSSIFTYNTIPLVIKDDQYYHITLAGEFCNLVVSQFLGLNSFSVNGLGIIAPKIIDFSKLSTNINDYEPTLEKFFKPSDSGTLFQSILPEYIQFKEFFEEWRCNLEIEKVLQRLTTSTPKEVPINSISWLIGDQE